jgi:hypothetical protein
VVFDSEATNLVVLDNDGAPDVFLVDTQLNCLPITRYCVAKTNSAGCTPRMTAVGAPHATRAIDSFFLVAYYALPARGQVWCFGVRTRRPFHGGTICVQSPLVRTPAQSADSMSIPLAELRDMYLPDLETHAEATAAPSSVETTV